jgi:7,8-dihydropterin-6-yl-methyl-4-(beta-D-ribofuranosyl)aminobenzene 5'-phosphate synthase
MARQANSGKFTWVLILVGLCNASASTATGGDTSPVRVNILYDAFGKAPGLTKDWGYAALIEYRGKRILFDTGNNPDILAKNARASSLDLSRLDLVILSHRHADHMGGMEYLLAVNPKVKIYAPKENFGVYGSSLPGTFYRRDESLPREQRYYDASPPATIVFGSAWPRAHFELIDSATEISPGLHVISLVSDKPGVLELRELSLAIETPDGLVLVVGCSHPGIENIVQAAASIDHRIHLIIGGLHLVTANDADIAKTVTSLHDTWKVDYIAPGHCTGEATFAALRKVFGDHYLYAGLGTRLTVAGVPTVAMITAATIDSELRTER